ncbi:hypothetical protein [Escherichia coli]|uniref:hypothetical protein n=1 Tax=Escherichia coli TaxID=562 RepID=UPI0013DFD03A|nr:hypothetical protein [Escherichia coli]
MSTENDEIINSLIRQINNFDKALQHAAARSDITLLAISFLASVRVFPDHGGKTQYAIFSFP